MFKTEIETFLELPRVADFVAVATEISLDDYKKLSDFERFSLVCECSDALLGSDVIKQFFCLVDTLCEEKFTSASLKSRQEQRKAWRTIHNDDLVSSSVASNGEAASVDYYKLYDAREYADIVELLFNEAKHTAQTLDEFIEHLCISNISSFFVASTDFEYLRPNNYQAQLVYQKISSGEKCKNSEIGLLVSHVICHVGKKKKCYLRFLADNVDLELKALVELFEKRSSDVEISICFNPFCYDLNERIFCLMLEKDKKISSEIIIPEDVEIDRICECLTRLLKKIPFSRIRPASRSAEVKFRSAIEIIRKNQ